MKGDIEYFNKYKNYQHIYIFMDDSGKLSKKEIYSVFAGIVFPDEKSKIRFCNKYKSIIKDINCNYCTFQKKSCNRNCPEIKNMTISASDRRRLFNLIKKETTYGVIIQNKKVYSHIINDKASKGRYIDYARKMIIKDVINELIYNSIIDPEKPLFLSVSCDQQSTASNGYYNLEESVYEELKIGITNFNYNMVINPIIFGKFIIDLKFMDSKKVWGIQASDILAGTLRRRLIRNNELNNNIVKIKRIMP